MSRGGEQLVEQRIRASNNSAFHIPLRPLDGTSPFLNHHPDPRRSPLLPIPHHMHPHSPRDSERRSPSHHPQHRCSPQQHRSRDQLHLISPSPPQSEARTHTPQHSPDHTPIIHPPLSHIIPQPLRPLPRAFQVHAIHPPRSERGAERAAEEEGREESVAEEGGEAEGALVEAVGEEEGWGEEGEHLDTCARGS